MNLINISQGKKQKENVNLCSTKLGWVLAVSIKCNFAVLLCIISGQKVLHNAFI